MITDFLARRAELSPNRTALIEHPSGSSATFAAWNARVNRTAGLLAGLGIGVGDRVAVYSSNRAEYLDLIFAAPKLGALLLNLNWRLTPAELSTIVAEGEPSVLVYSGEWAENVDGLTHGDVTVVALDDARAGEVSFSDRDGIDPEDPPLPDVGLDHPWGIYPTGGTTGIPKGAVITHGNITWNNVNTVTSWGLHAGHVAPLQLPMFHIGGPNIFMHPLVHVGGATVLTGGFDPGETLQLIGSGLLTHYVGVPTMYQMMIDHPDFESTDFSAMELVISGGAPCPQPIMERFWDKGVDFKTGYGLTEASGNNFWLPPEQVRSKPGSVGYPLMHIRARVVADDGSRCGPGEAGELQLAGPHVFDGYWRRPDASAEAVQDGWLRTGDVAITDEDGAYRVIGRSKEMYISGGENVYPAEVESVIAGHPAVAEAAVAGIPDEKWGEVGAAFVAAKPGESLDAPELLRYCGERLARYKLPRRITFLEVLPKTAIGKHDKKAMVAGLIEGETL